MYHPPIAAVAALLSLLSLLVFVLPAPPAWAQPGVGGEIETAGADAQSEPEPEPVPPEHASARATLGTFLEAFYAGTDEERKADLETAAACLDLSRLPASVRASRGPELAIQLKDIIDRTVYVELDEVSDDPEAPPYELLRQEEGAVVLAPDERGEWRFTAETVEDIPELWQAKEGTDVVQGVEEAAPRTFAMWLSTRVPPSLRQRTLFLAHWQWLGLLLLVFFGLAVDRLVVALVGALVKRRFRVVDAALVGRSLRPVGLVAMALVWSFGLRQLLLPLGAFKVLDWAARFVAVTSAVWALYRAVDILAAVLERRAGRTESRFDDLLVPLLRKTLKVFIVAFGLVFIAETLDLEITSLIAGLGLGGLALALAAQDTVRNFFGSITVLTDRPFAVGDWVLIGDVEGTVEEMGFRSTRIRTFHNSLINLPNSNLINAAVDNYGARRYRRWKQILSLAYETPPEKIEAFCEGVRELIRRHPHTRKDSYMVYLNQFGAASLDVLLYMFFDTPDWGTELRERHRLAVDILRLAADLGVEFAYPTQTLYLRRGAAREEAEALADEAFTAAIREARERGRGRADALAAGSTAELGPPPEGGAAGS